MKFSAWILPALLFASPLQSASLDEDDVAHEAAAGQEWLLRGGNFKGEHFSPLDQVNRDNVATLRGHGDWVWSAANIYDPAIEEEEKNDKGKNDYRWIDENVKMARLYLLPIQKDANGKREPRRIARAGRRAVDQL